MTPDELQTWLEWAGIRLISMPGGRVGPSDYRVYWPEYSQDKFQVLQFRNFNGVKVAPPNGKEIGIVEKILLLPNLCERQVTRRVLHVRCLLHPVNMRYLYPWSRVAQTLQIKASSARYIHKTGLQEVCHKVDEKTVCTISNLLNEALADISL